MIHSRKVKWYAVVILLAAIIGMSVARAAWAADKPNIVMLMTDDTGWGDFGAYSGGGWGRGKGPSARHEIFYFGGPHLGALRIDDFKFQFFQQP